MFKDTTSEEFYLKRNATQFLKLNRVFSTKIGGALRSMLSTNLTDISDNKINKLSSTKYLKSLSLDLPCKIGARFGESDFIALGLSRDFIKICSYYWVGGRSRLKEGNKSTSIIEEAFLSIFYEECKKKLEESLSAFGTMEFEIGYIDDKTIALPKDIEILHSSAKFGFGDNEAEMTIIGTSPLISSMQADPVENEHNSFQMLIGNEIKQSLVAELCELQLTPNELQNLYLGQRIRIDSPNEANVMVLGSTKPLCKGFIGHNETSDRVIKI